MAALFGVSFGGHPGQNAVPFGDAASVRASAVFVVCLEVPFYVPAFGRTDVPFAGLVSLVAAVDQIVDLGS